MAKALMVLMIVVESLNKSVGRRTAAGMGILTVLSVTGDPTTPNRYLK